MAGVEKEIIVSGKPGNMSEKQTRILEDFRKQVSDIIPAEQLKDDYYMTRWLRAREYDMKKSEKMLRNHMEWRKRYSADTVTDNYITPESIAKYHTGGLAGKDKDGAPFWWDAYGRCDIKGILHCCKKNDLLLWKINLLERGYKEMFPRLSEEEGKRVDSINVVFDLKGFGLNQMWKPAVDLFLEVVQMFEDHYPETLKRSVIINAPKIMPMIWRIVKPFLSEVTAKKVIICTNNGLSTFEKFADLDNIPVEFGGRLPPKENPEDPLELLNLGKAVPKSEYKTGMSGDENDLTSISVSARRTHDIPMTVTTPCSTLHYEFVTEEHDIAFGIFFREKNEGQEVEVHGTKRCNSHLVPEDGSLTCDKPGTYICRFNNKHSMLRSKTVIYHIVVNPPGEHSNENSALHMVPEQQADDESERFQQPSEDTENTSM